VGAQKVLMFIVQEASFYRRGTRLASAKDVSRASVRHRRLSIDLYSKCKRLKLLSIAGLFGDSRGLLICNMRIYSITLVVVKPEEHRDYPSSGPKRATK
jgi:hypothetical protein